MTRHTSFYNFRHVDMFGTGDTSRHRGFAEASAEKICVFEVLQFSSDCASLSQAELSLCYKGVLHTAMIYGVL